jgi:hypothetical protein
MQFGSKNTSIKHTINKSSTININFENRKNLTINFTLLIMALESFPWITELSFCPGRWTICRKLSVTHYPTHTFSHNQLQTLYCFSDRLCMLFLIRCNSHYIMTTVNLQSAIICVRAKHFTVLHTLGQVTLKIRMSPGQNPNSELLASHPCKLY